MNERTYPNLVRNALGVFAAVVAALLVVGVAWASGDDASTQTSLASETQTSVSAASSSSSQSQPSTSTTIGSASSTLGEGGSTSTSLGGSTSTTINSSTSTTLGIGSSTSTTLDDDDDNDDDDDRDNSRDNSSALVDGTHQFAVGTAGSVSVQVLAGRLILLDVSANAGWDFEIEKNRSDEIEIRFESGDRRNEFEARIHNGALELEIETN